MDDPYSVITKDDVYNYFISIGLPEPVCAKLKHFGMDGKRLMAALPSELTNQFGVTEKEPRSAILVHRKEILEWYKENQNNRGAKKINMGGSGNNTPPLPSEDGYMVGEEDKLFINQICPILAKSLIDLKDFLQKRLPFYNNPEQQKMRVEKTLKTLVTIRDNAYEEFLPKVKPFAMKPNDTLNDVKENLTNTLIDCWTFCTRAPGLISVLTFLGLFRLSLLLDNLRGVLEFEFNRPFELSTPTRPPGAKEESRNSKWFFSKYERSKSSRRTVTKIEKKCLFDSQKFSIQFLRFIVVGSRQKNV